MRRYRVVIMLVLFGVLPVVAAFFIALSFLSEPEHAPVQTEVDPVVEEEPSAEPPEIRRVYAAARALPVGTLLGDDDLTVQDLDPKTVDRDYVRVTGDSADRALRGYVVREALEEGVPLTRASVVGPGQKGFLAAVLKPGTRAVTVEVGRATGHAGLLDSGDRVDVILSAELTVDVQNRSVFAKTIVQDARVVAIDRRVGSGAEAPAEGLEGEATVERSEVTTVTLEVSPAQGERLVLGEQQGSLSLAVRSLLSAASETGSGALTGPPADLPNMLLSPAEASASERRIRRQRTLDELSVRTQIAETEQELRAAMEAGATKRTTVRIFRGSEPAEELAFARP